MLERKFEGTTRKIRTTNKKNKQRNTEKPARNK